MALCDVDSNFAAKTFARYPKASNYRDYREMLDKEKGIDAVIIATPDHSHASVAMAAIHMGKHVYCAKPMTRTIFEARAVTKAARDAKVATQMSVQSCASEDACTLAEIIQSGAIGPVRDVHVWTDRPLWPQGVGRPSGRPAVPPGLDWDLWLGPAARRPYNPAYHPFDWRGWYDFGTGALGDMALHTFHAVFRALNLTSPTSVSCSTTALIESAPEGQRDPVWSRSRKVTTPETFPMSSLVTWNFAARAGMPPVRLHWYDGGLRPPTPTDLDPAQTLATQGTYFSGEKGTLLIGRIMNEDNATGMEKGLLPAAKFKDYQLPPKTLERTNGHYKEWIAAAKDGPPASCTFEFARLLAETALLGVISQRTAKSLVWDAENMRTNDAEANQYLKPLYRAGWSL
jgi:predicted dehydrogenase